MNISKPIDIQKIQGISPFNVSATERSHADWANELKKMGWDLLASNAHAEDLQNSKSASKLVAMPPFLRVGRLEIETNSENDLYTSNRKYVATATPPALVSFRENTVLRFASHTDRKRIETVAQTSLVRLLCQMDSALVKVTAVDLSNFGASVSILSAACGSLNLIATKQALNDFLNELVEDVTKRNISLGISHDYLYSFNEGDF